MTPTPKEPAQPSDDERKPQKKRKKKPKVRTHTPRPDELSRECFEFIAAVDEYKRRRMRSFLEDREVLEILFDLGYRREGHAPRPTASQLQDYAEARQRYRVEQGRLFPTWSEVFELFTTLGYHREERGSAA